MTDQNSRRGRRKGNSGRRRPKRQCARCTFLYDVKLQRCAMCGFPAMGLKDLRSEAEYPSISSPNTEKDVTKGVASDTNASTDVFNGSDDKTQTPSKRACELGTACRILKDPSHMHRSTHMQRFDHPDPPESPLTKLAVSRKPVPIQLAQRSWSNGTDPDLQDSQWENSPVSLSLRLARGKGFPSDHEEFALPPCPNGPNCHSVDRPQHACQFSHTKPAGAEAVAGAERKGRGQTTGLDAGLVPKTGVGDQLLQAAQDGDTSELRRLLAAASQGQGREDVHDLVRRTNEHGDTALLLAAREGHSASVQLLLARTADVTHQNVPEGFSALHVAALHARDAVIPILLEGGAMLEQRDVYGNTPLMCACFRGHLSTVELLLQQGAHIDTVAKGGNTPLLMAAKEGHAYTVQCLVSRGANTRVHDKEGRSVEDYAAARPELALALKKGLHQLASPLALAPLPADPPEQTAWPRLPHKPAAATSPPLDQSPAPPGGPAPPAAPATHLARGESAPYRSREVAEWTDYTVVEWIKEKGFSMYAESFKENMVNGELLLDLSAEDMEKDLGITNRMHRRRLLLEIQKLVSGASTPSPSVLTPQPAFPASSATSTTPSPDLSAPALTPQPVAPPAWGRSRSQTGAEVTQNIYEQFKPSHGLDVSARHGIRLVRFHQLSEVRQIAEGHFAKAYAAKLDEKEVVVKVPKQRPGQDEWSELNTFLHVPPHPNLLPFVGICQDFKGQRNLCIITVRQVSSLKDLLGDSVVLPVRLVSVVYQMAAALAHLHQHNVIHRDIAARNVLISSDGTAVLCDFGLSRAVESRESRQSSTEESGAKVTEEVPNYESYYRVQQQSLLPIRWMAPESLRFGKFTRKSDVWMFGVLVWEILTHARLRPYPNTAHTNEVVIGVCTGTLRLVQSLEDVSPGLVILREVVEDCLLLSPEERPTMDGVAQRLNKFLQNKGQPVKAPPPRKGRRKKKDKEESEELATAAGSVRQPSPPLLPEINPPTYQSFQRTGPPHSRESYDTPIGDFTSPRVSTHDAKEAGEDRTWKPSKNGEDRTGKQSKNGEDRTGKQSKKNSRATQPLNQEQTALKGGGLRGREALVMPEEVSGKQNPKGTKGKQKKR